MTGTNVMVVDDDARNSYAMRAFLEGRRASVIVAASGPESLVMLVNGRPVDIVLMDIMMPEMDGYETIRSVRSIVRFEALPIIAVTGKVVSGERERCLAAGANDYIPKPVESIELVSALKPWLRRTG